ncbi:MAG: hypothetical protein K0R18_1271, partial [Bacillales bacterium]|nr:hypothetical protein [Bacillales bacterium]
MRKTFKFDSGEYTVHMQVIEKTSIINISAYKG